MLVCFQLTVAVVASIYGSLQSLSLCKLGQHLCQPTWNLCSILTVAVVTFREFQRKIPEGLYCV